MAIREAERVSGGTFCNLKALAGEDPEDYGVLVCIRVVEWEDEDEPASKGEYGWNMPFIYDAIIVHVEEDADSGELRQAKVETYLRQSMKYGNNPMWVIRGHERPDAKTKRSELPKPADEVGTETIGRVRWKDGKRPYIVMNKPSARERKIILDAREELGGDAWGGEADGDLF